VLLNCAGHAVGTTCRRARSFFSILKRAISILYVCWSVGGTLQALRAGGHVPFPFLNVLLWVWFGVAEVGGHAVGITCRRARSCWTWPRSYLWISSTSGWAQAHQPIEIPSNWHLLKVHIKPSLPLLMSRILENLLLASIKGSYMIYKINFCSYLKTFSLKTTRNYRSSPHNGPIKFFSLQNLNI
jgi:hypothetical protein